MSTRLQQQVNKFGSDEQGAVALMFGLMSFVLFFMGAIAVDYSRVIDMRSRVVSSVELCVAGGRPRASRRQADQTPKSSNSPPPTSTKTSRVPRPRVRSATPDIKIDRENGTIDIDVQSSVTMTLARVGGFEKMDIPVKSAATYKQKDIEVGMALDITGSMDEVGRWQAQDRRSEGRVRAVRRPSHSGTEVGRAPRPHRHCAVFVGHQPRSSTPALSPTIAARTAALPNAATAN